MYRLAPAGDLYVMMFSYITAIQGNSHTKQVTNNTGDVPKKKVSILYVGNNSLLYDGNNAV